MQHILSIAMILSGAVVLLFSFVDFTHSICPDCLKRLYPDLYK